MNTPTLTFEQFQALVRIAIGSPYRNGLRKGQVIFNELNAFNPQLANLIRGTSEDPFYQDNRIPDFLNKLACHLA